MTRRLLSVGVALCVLMLGTSCAGLRQQQRREEETRVHVYRRPIAELWPQVRGYVSAKGYPFRGAMGQYALVTEWREHFHGSRVASEYTRLLVQGISYRDGTSRVFIWRESLSSGNLGPPSREESLASQQMVRYIGTGGDPLPARKGTRRDLEMEWELMQLLAPEDAQSIEQKVASK